MLVETGFRRNQIAERTTAIRAVKGLQIHLGIPFMAFVGETIEMDGHAGNDKQILIRADKPCLKSIRCADHYPACNRKRPVEPGTHDHAAIALSFQFPVNALFQVKVFDTPGRCISMRKDHAPAVDSADFRQAECQDCGTVPRRVIPAAWCKVPRRTFLQAAIPCPLQPIRRFGSGMPWADTGINKVKYGLDLIHISGVPPFLHTKRGLPGRWPKSAASFFIANTS